MMDLCTGCTRQSRPNQQVYYTSGVQQGA